MKAKLLGLLVLALVFAVAATGCTPAGGGDILVYGRGADSVSLDPINVTDGESLKVTHQIYDTLVEYKPDSTEVEPALATEWSTSPDGLVWTFKLREGVKFHDGTPFNAEAVKFNFDRWMFTDNPHRYDGEFAYYAYMFGGFDDKSVIESVEVVDEYTVRFTLREPLAPFLQNLAMTPFGIASPEAIKEFGPDFGQNPVGTGPFKFVEWVKDDKIVLEANKDYWEGEPALDQIIFRSIPDNSARFMELQAGNIDIMDGLNPPDVKIVEEDENLQLFLRPPMNVGYLAMNMDVEPFDNLLVRQAINHAINKEALIENFYAGLAQPAVNPMPPSIWGFNYSVKPYEYDPERAKELLAEAGFPNGFKTELWAMPIPRPYMPQPRKIAEAIQADLAKIGIEAEIVSFDWGAYLQKVENGEHPMALLGWIGDNGDPDNFLYVLLDKDNAVKGSAGNIAFYRSDKVHELLIKAQRTFDKAERTRLYEEAQVIIHRDAPWVPLVYAQQPIAAKASIRGYIPHATGSEKLNTVYLETE